MSRSRLQVGGVKLQSRGVKLVSWLNGRSWRSYLTVALLPALYRVYSGEDEQEVVSRSKTAKSMYFEDEQDVTVSLSV